MCVRSTGVARAASHTSPSLPARVSAHFGVARALELHEHTRTRVWSALGRPWRLACPSCAEAINVPRMSEERTDALATLRACRDRPSLRSRSACLKESLSNRVASSSVLRAPKQAQHIERILVALTVRAFAFVDLVRLCNQELVSRAASDITSRSTTAPSRPRTIRAARMS
jgi:hypothetical protein